MAGLQTGASQTGAPLPVGEVVREAYRLLFNQPFAWLRALALPLAIDVAVQLAFLSAYGPSLAAGALTPEQVDGSVFLRSLGLQLCVLIAYVLFCVSWHRFALLGPAEGPRVVPPVQGRHVRFLLTTIGLSLLIGLVVAVPAVLLSLAKFPALATVIALAVLGAVFFTRLQLVFPAIAVERPLSIGASWAATKGQAIRLFLVLLLSVLPWAVVGYFTSGLFLEDQIAFIRSGELNLGTVLAYAISGLVSYALLAVVVGCVSGAYRRLVGL